MCFYYTTLYKHKPFLFSCSQTELNVVSITGFEHTAGRGQNLAGEEQSS